MSLIDVVLSRRSIRSYEKKKVPEDVMSMILESGRQAPSAANRQPWHFVVLTEKDLKEKLSYRGMNTFVKDSAFTVVGCAYVGDRMGRRWSTIDTSIALQNMVIAAWALGVGSCWIGAFREETVKELLNIPDDWNVLALVSFGYPAEDPVSKQKKPFHEVVSFNEFKS